VTRLILRRSLYLLLTLLVTSMLVFWLTQLLPGDVARLILGRDASAEAIQRFNEANGLNEPVINQYVNWLSGFVTGDWGNSYSGGGWAVQPVVLERLGNSLRLAGLVLLISLPVALVQGVLAALQEDRLVDSVLSVASLSVIGLPEFLTGIVLINVFALNLGWFSATSLVQPGYDIVDWLRVLILPALTASLVLIGYITRMTRAGMIDELKQAYVRTAILKGLPRRVVIVRHVLRNALLPTITVIAISVGWLIGGIVVVERVFSYPGLGSLLVEAVEQKNLPVLQASVMVVVFVFALTNLLADVLYGALNPRIRAR
jgi:peptide/nickel transport system permease protein